jgi:hypothetical protein
MSSFDNVLFEHLFSTFFQHVYLLSVSFGRHGVFLTRCLKHCSFEHFFIRYVFILTCSLSDVSVEAPLQLNTFSFDMSSFEHVQRSTYRLRTAFVEHEHIRVNRHIWVHTFM